MGSCFHSGITVKRHGNLTMFCACGRSFSGGQGMEGGDERWRSVAARRAGNAVALPPVTSRGDGRERNMPRFEQVGFFHWMISGQGKEPGQGYADFFYLTKLRFSAINLQWMERERKLVNRRTVGYLLVLFLFLIHLSLFAQGTELAPEEAPTDSAAPGDSLFPDSLADLLAPTDVVALDTPNDQGGNVTISWTPPPDEMGIIFMFEIFGSQSKDAGFGMMGVVTARTTEYRAQVPDGVGYFFKVRASTKDETYSPFSEVSPEVVARPQWFHTGRINALVAVALFIGFILLFVSTARKGRSLFIRRIAGLDALDEAVGRATEMGKPILYVPGLSSMSDVATIAAINILGPVAKKVAEYESTIIVPNRDPIVMTVARQVVKESFLEAGRPDAFNEDMVFFLTDSQFGYAAAVDGIMVRERPATNLFLGMFWAESLILAETGNMTGAIQIAGTDAVAQLPFFVTACDYTIIGEELYAASAYLSKTPVLVGSLKAQDVGKAIIIAAVLGMFILSIVNTIFLISGDMPNSVLTRIIVFFQNMFNV